MDSTFYTQHGFLKAQLEVWEAVMALANEKQMRLDAPIWNDGNLALPKPGEPIKLRLSSRGIAETVSFTPQALDDFLSGRMSIVGLKLGQTLNSVRAK